MSHFEDAMRMNISINRQNEMFRGQCPEIDRMRDRANENRLLAAMQMDDNERRNERNNNNYHFGAHRSF